MPQAKIEINGTAGSDEDLPINVLVQLSNEDVGGEVTYTYTYDPAHRLKTAADSLFSMLMTSRLNCSINPRVWALLSAATASSSNMSSTNFRCASSGGYQVTVSTKYPSYIVPSDSNRRLRSRSMPAEIGSGNEECARSL